MKTGKMGIKMLNWTVDRGTGAETAVLSVVSLTVIYDYDEDAYIGVTLLSKPGRW